MEETFTLFRPVFYLLTILVLSNFVYIMFLSKKIKPGFYLILNSFFILYVLSVLHYQEGILTDALVLDGDGLTFILMIIVFVICVLSLILYYLRSQREFKANKKQSQENIR